MLDFDDSQLNVDNAKQVTKGIFKFLIESEV